MIVESHILTAAFGSWSFKRVSAWFPSLIIHEFLKKQIVKIKKRISFVSYTSCTNSSSHEKFRKFALVSYTSEAYKQAQHCKFVTTLAIKAIENSQVLHTQIRCERASLCQETFLLFSPVISVNSALWKRAATEYRKTRAWYTVDSLEERCAHV